MNETGRSRWKVIGIFDDNPSHIGKMIEGIEVLGTTNDAFNIFPERSYFHCAIGKNEDGHPLFVTNLDMEIPATLIHPKNVTGPNSVK